MSDERLPEKLGAEVGTATAGPWPSLGSQVRTVSGDLPPDSPQRTCLVEIHGDAVERQIRLTASAYSIGRTDDNDIVLHSASVSRHHARLEQRGSSYEIVDLDSTNGTHVNEARVQRCPLRHDDLLVIGGTAFRYLATPALETALAEVADRIARTDGLTQIPNRAALEEALRDLGRRGAAAALIVAQVDDLTALRQRYSPLAMDRVITLLAGQLKQRIRRTDLLARIDERQFALLLDGADEATARRKADSLRRHVALSTFRFRDEQIPITLTTAVVPVQGGPELDAAAALPSAQAGLSAGPTPLPAPR